MRFWNIEIRWVSPQKETFEWNFPTVTEDFDPRPTVKKATTRPKKAKDENKSPKRTTKARKVTKSA